MQCTKQNASQLPVEILQLKKYHPLSYLALPQPSCCGPIRVVCHSEDSSIPPLATPNSLPSTAVESGSCQSVFEWSADRKRDNMLQPGLGFALKSPYYTEMRRVFGASNASGGAFSGWDSLWTLETSH